MKERSDVCSCLLWVKSGRDALSLRCPLLPRKQTFRWDTCARKPNDPMEWFCVPLFSKTLTLLVWRGPLGSAKIFYHIIYFFDELSHFEKADSNLATVNPCLLLTRKRTSNSGSRTSALCQDLTLEPVSVLRSIAQTRQTYSALMFVALMISPCPKADTRSA